MINPKAISQNRDICKVVKEFLTEYPFLEYKNGGKHGKVFSRKAKDYILVSKTPSDFRATKNLEADLRRLVNKGIGVIAMSGAKIHAA